MSRGPALRKSCDTKRCGSRDDRRTKEVGRGERPSEHTAWNHERRRRHDMPLDTFTLFASQYATEEDALIDYDAVRSLYVDLDIIDTYDAAVVSKDPDGKVRIVKHVEEPTRQGAAAGIVMGLAVGALVALFPAVALGAGLALGGASGAALGATAGHVAAGMSRSDLKDLGELLDAGTSGLVVIAAADTEDRVEAAIEHGKDIMKKQVQIDADGLKKDIDSL